jgi:hypothetical protein
MDLITNYIVSFYKYIPGFYRSVYSVPLLSITNQSLVVDVSVKKENIFDEEIFVMDMAYSDVIHGIQGISQNVICSNARAAILVDILTNWRK